MLQIKNITKKYQIGESIQTALDCVSLNFRDNEFVAILGTSGAGKTTLLNIIGGLDRYDSGDLIINGISTKKYKDRDWDSYRNHTIGFVFQSYNLIPHQSVLSNVELALTISGISKKERIERAKKALIEVGLEQHMYKKPNQLSGGQMQRVAIARALVNNPSILLADEPTGALDSDTSIQVMDMLKEVAKDRLVVMVTHNPELAEEYANRIVKIKDGKVLNDTNPYVIEKEESSIDKNMGKSSMSLLTSLSLSFNNLRTKKARTFLTAFAGSIGIIGIAMILSFSNGVNQYIKDIQKETMTSYPITIEKSTLDLSGILGSSPANNEMKIEHEKEGVYMHNLSMTMASSLTNSVVQNDLSNFKKYLEDKNNEINQYIGENGISYSYDLDFDIVSYDPNGILINADGSSLKESDIEKFGNSNIANMSQASSSMSSKNKISCELLTNQNGETAPIIQEMYEIVVGSFPTNYNEFILVLNQNNEIDMKVLYNLGILPSEDYNKLVEKINSEDKVKYTINKVNIEDILNHELYIIPKCDFYEKGEDGNYFKNKEITEKMLKKAIKVKISGIVKPKEGEETTLIGNSLGYLRSFTEYVINYINNSEVVKAQENNNETNILNGYKFEVKSNEEKAIIVKEYLENMTIEEKLEFISKQVPNMGETQNSTTNSIINETNSNKSDEMMAMQMLQMFDSKVLTLTNEELANLYDEYISSGSYNDNMKKFGIIDINKPNIISIYVDSFENKENISRCIEEYNKLQDDENKIVYTDYIGLILSSVTTIIDVISYVLIAFVSVSLVVSSIMIGIITYISVLERTKEIGILRAMGASKKNISQVFNAETFIIGLLSGLLGVGITYLLLIPANMIIHNLTNNLNVNAILPITSAIILVGLSVILTLIGGVIPSKKAAKQNPVNALRSE